MKNAPFLLLSVFFGASYGVAAGADIHRVDVNATGANNGDTWTNAYTNLDSVLDNVAVAGDQVWVKIGLYKPGGTDRENSFRIPSGVKVYGGFDGTETLLTERQPDPDPFIVDQTTDSVLSGDRLGNDAITSSTDCTSLGGTWNGTACLDQWGLTVTRNSDN